MRAKGFDHTTEGAYAAAAGVARALDLNERRTANAAVTPPQAVELHDLGVVDKEVDVEPVALDIPVEDLGPLGSRGHVQGGERA